ncbi:conserved hypothetical protein [metagenome]|uniref:Thioesterase domain-containing protein n=1 Tax=metagenome TaxID=256318 RepID=A0A2P2C3V6_9ZZZZ
MNHSRSDRAGAASQPEVEARVRDSFARQGLMRLLHAELVEVTPGRVRIDLPRRPEVSQQHGYVHAGATSAIADSAGGYAALTLMRADFEVLTVEYKLNLLAPAAGNRLEAIGTVLKSGRTLSVCQLEVYAINDEAHQPPTLVAAGQQTLISIPGQDAS